MLTEELMFRNESQEIDGPPWIRNRDRCCNHERLVKRANYNINAFCLASNGSEQLATKISRHPREPGRHCRPTPAGEARHVVAMTPLIDPPLAK
jgi:hypothetical protein